MAKNEIDLAAEAKVIHDSLNQIVMSLIKLDRAGNGLRKAVKLSQLGIEVIRNALDGHLPLV